MRSNYKLAAYRRRSTTDLRHRYFKICLRSYRTCRSVWFGYDGYVPNHTGVRYRCEAVPNHSGWLRTLGILFCRVSVSRSDCFFLPKCRVQVLRSYRSSGSVGTGMEIVPNLAEMECTEQIPPVHFDMCPTDHVLGTIYLQAGWCTIVNPTDHILGIDYLQAGWSSGYVATLECCFKIALFLRVRVPPTVEIMDLFAITNQVESTC